MPKAVLLSILNRTPGMIVRCLNWLGHGWIHGLVSKNFEVDLRTEHPVSIEFGQSVPCLSVWLRYTNKSGFMIRVDRVLLEISVGQPIIRDGAILRPTEIQPGQTLGNHPSQLSIAFYRELFSEQRDAVLKELRTNKMAARIAVYVHAYCEYKTGPFNVSVQRECSLPDAIGGLDVSKELT